MMVTLSVYTLLFLRALAAKASWTGLMLLIRLANARREEKHVQICYLITEIMQGVLLCVVCAVL